MEIDLIPSLKQFKIITNRIAQLGQIAALAGWDQQTYMPPAAAQSRGEQMAAISEVIHELSIADETGRALSCAESDTAGMDPDSDDVRMLRVARRSYDLALKLPGSLVAEMSRQQAIAMSVWQEARATSDYARFAPALTTTLDLVREAVGYIGYTEHMYDALIDQYEQGATHASVAAMYADLTPHLVKLTGAIRQAIQVDDAAIYGHFPVDKQKETTLRIVRALGYDLTRGRQDEAAHPFCTSFSRDDVRITTRFDTGFLQQALYASLHEAGHAMYEQGIPSVFTGTPLANAASLGIHESQSQLWENQVGRSLPFARFVFPILRAAYPDALRNESAESYYRAVNKVAPSLIRVEADEVTYNLHVALRFEIESRLLTGELAVKDVPAAWNAKMTEYLGISPTDDAVGVLQDVHWAIGLIGYFPTYSIGNLVSAQLWNTLTQALPDVEIQIERGEFSTLLQWLNTNIHVHGCKYLPAELLQKASGAPLSPSHFVDYLNKKYAQIYGI